MKMTRSVVIEPPYVIKHVVPGLVDIEARRLEAAWQVAKTSGAFLVPEVYDVCSRTGRLVMEYLPDLLHPLGEDIGLSGNRSMRIERIGWVLAYLHDTLDVAQSMSYGTRVGGGEWNADDVVVHGDCRPDHTLWSREAEKVVIIDWAGLYVPGPVPVMGTYGSRYRDVAFWLAEFVYHSLHPKLFSRWPDCLNLAKCFLNGYEQQFGRRISEKEVERRFRAYLAMRQNKQRARRRAGHGIGWRRQCRLTTMQVLGNRLLRSNWRQRVRCF